MSEPEGNGGGPSPDSPGSERTLRSDSSGNGALAEGPAPAVKKLTRDALRLIDAIREMANQGESQSLRKIAARTGLSKDEVNRYLNPEVRELYGLDRLVYVRNRNRPLYNYLIVSGPPEQEEDEWVGIKANTSKFDLFDAVCRRYGYDLSYVGERGQIVDLAYQGIEKMAADRMGKQFSSDEPVLHIDHFL